MALKFGETKGKAQKTKVDAYEYKDGENRVRLFGGVLPRYVYWLKGTNNKDIPVECLAFDRELEKFNNREVDHVPEFFSDKKCSWAYSINCLDADGNEKALNLKKKLFEQIMTAAEDLGDPTDPDAGWDIVFKKVKTGPLPFNVEYQLSVLKCKPRALSEAERETVAKAKSIDEKFPRPTAQEVHDLLVKITTGAADDDADTSGADAETAKDL
ncbi:hypothetical protein UFOVP273_24 [uncultured Caudovirales phage]|uniref:Uncharacterized protein n=1 Tax=uncultured Caudovirales phage TaxID=2100421 RepID=A0A6J5LR87_9CAUD|nr:hypothetical protein UFOVP273_24 [uncultured Caudovirales phage]